MKKPVEMTYGAVGRSCSEVDASDYQGGHLEVPEGSLWVVLELCYVGDDPADTRWTVALLDEDGVQDGTSYEGAWQGFLEADKLDKDLVASWGGSWGCPWCMRYFFDSERADGVEDEDVLCPDCGSNVMES